MATAQNVEEVLRQKLCAANKIINTSKADYQTMRDDLDKAYRQIKEKEAENENLRKRYNAMDKPMRKQIQHLASERDKVQDELKSSLKSEKLQHTMVWME